MSISDQTAAALWRSSKDYGEDLRLSEKLLSALREATFDGVGISRPAFSPLETKAQDIVGEEARALGLAVSRDEAQNLVMTLEGADRQAPPILIGSHLDSVPQGGNFDGAAGVLAGLLILAGLKRAGIVPKRTLKAYGLRGEESSRFGKAYMGSLTLMGRIAAADLALKDADGVTLKDAMRQTGLPVDKIERGEKLLDPASVGAWLELHIEQGPLLIARKQPAGVVSGIRGNVRHKRVEGVGEAAHSGATPKELRKDAVFAAGDLMMRADRLWNDYLKQRRDLVVTFGVFGTDPKEHAIAKVPGFVSFSVDIRSQDKATLEAYHAAFKQLAQDVEQERGVAFRFDNRIDSAPATLDAGWTERLRQAAVVLGISDEPVPSGAGHDAAVFAQSGIPSAMVFVRNEHGSHNPHEAMDIDDFLAGVALIREAVVSFAG
ncbi:MAG: Zn-dependent hydrolase [Methylobacteriaceae bacterium]|jgi:N-carbamoyl-L-amino-acid hydrolase|nr:Zn-dependent hydrolase [Methylobacteriaceae bacterium]